VVEEKQIQIESLARCIEKTGSSKKDIKGLEKFEVGSNHEYYEKIKETCKGHHDSEVSERLRRQKETTLYTEGNTFEV